MDFVSIIVPIYNGEKYLTNLFESIDKQIFNNYELLLINDGSTDNTEKICQSYLKKNNKAKYFYKENSGVSDTRNYGIKLSAGKYICFIDADDLIMDSYLSDFMSMIMNEDWDLLCCDLLKISNPSLNDYKLQNNKHFTYNIFLNESKYDVLFSKYGGYMCNKLYKADIIKDNNITFDIDIGMCEDMLFIFKYLSFSRKIKCIDKKNYIYRIISTSASKNLNNTKWFSVYLVMDKLLIGEKYYSQKIYSKIMYTYITYLYQGLYRLKFIKKHDNYIKIKKDIYTRLKKINYGKYNFSFSKKVKIIMYKYFNSISFYLKLKKDKNN